MSRRLTGNDIDVQIGAFRVVFSEASLAIDDSSKAVGSKNLPNGYIRGKVSAGGDITVDTANLNVMIDAARQAGSWQELPPFDMTFNGSTTSESLNIECFECLLKLSDVLSATESEEKLTHKISYEVTGPDFVKINGVNYVASSLSNSLR